VLIICSKGIWFLLQDITLDVWLRIRIANRDKLGQPPPYVDHHSARQTAKVKRQLTSGHERKEILKWMSYVMKFQILLHKSHIFCVTPDSYNPSVQDLKTIMLAVILKLQVTCAENSDRNFQLQLIQLWSSCQKHNKFLTQSIFVLFQLISFGIGTLL